MIFFVLFAILMYAEWHCDERGMRLTLLAAAGLNLFAAWVIVRADLGLI